MKSKQRVGSFGKWGQRFLLICCICLAAINYKEPKLTNSEKIGILKEKQDSRIKQCEIKKTKRLNKDDMLNINGGFCGGNCYSIEYRSGPPPCGEAIYQPCDFWKFCADDDQCGSKLIVYSMPYVKTVSSGGKTSYSTQNYYCDRIQDCICSFTPEDIRRCQMGLLGEGTIKPGDYLTGNGC